jgi:hypothetical protein
MPGIFAGQANNVTHRDGLAFEPHRLNEIDFRLWHEADMPIWPRDVRFREQNGSRRTLAICDPGADDNSQ